MEKKFILLFALFITAFLSYGQNEIDSVLSKKEIRKSRPVFYDIGIGFNNSKFRDFATSPLIYKGTRQYVSINRIKMDQRRETSFGLAYSFGTNSSTTDYFATGSKVQSIFLDYSRLYQVPRWSTSSLNFKVGGKINHTSNLRTNPSLQNNAIGFESINTLFASAKVTKDITRKRNKTINLLLFKINLKPIKRDISFRANIGVMNNTHRNGFVYIGQSGILNEQKLFDGYKLKIFSGARIGSVLDYTVYLKNNNGLKLSYEWDAYKTGGNLDKFEMSNHILKFSFLFKM